MPTHVSVGGNELRNEVVKDAAPRPILPCSFPYRDRDLQSRPVSSAGGSFDGLQQDETGHVQGYVPLFVPLFAWAQP